MPFASIAQANACVAKKSKGWDCAEAFEKTQLCRLPYRVGGKGHPDDRPCKGSACKVRIGPRGGQYVLCRNNRKVYVPVGSPMRLKVAPRKKGGSPSSKRKGK